MKTLHISLLAAMWGMQLSAGSGCAVSGENLSKKGVVKVERVPSERVAIPWADVYRSDEGLIVRGVVRRRDYSSQPLLIHVDATVLSGDGEVLTEATGRDLWVPRRRVGRGFNHVDFEIRLPATAPEGSTVKLVCHPGSRDLHPATDTTRK